MQEVLDLEKQYDGPKLLKKGDFETEFMKRLKYAKDIIAASM